MPVIKPDAQWYTCKRLLNNKVQRAVPVQVPRSKPGKRVFREKDQLFFLLPGIVNLNAEDPLPDRLAHADQNCAKSACVMDSIRQKLANPRGHERRNEAEKQESMKFLRRISFLPKQQPLQSR